MDRNLCWLMFAAGVLIDTRDTHCAQHCSTNDFATDCKQTQTGFKRLENATTVCLVLNLLLVLGWTRSNPSITFSFSFSRYWICLESKLPLGRYLSGLSILSSTLLQSLHLTNPKYCEYSLLIFFFAFRWPAYHGFSVSTTNTFRLYFWRTWLLFKWKSFL